jgi:hypothetical protein
MAAAAVEAGIPALVVLEGFALFGVQELLPEPSRLLIQGITNETFYSNP